jgi:alkylation response protein AidB-like acyl-CoA dehydrogenase
MDGHFGKAFASDGLNAAFAAVADKHDREASFPFGNIARLHEAGLLGLTVPQRHGGSEAGLRDATEVVREIGRGCASTALVLAMQLIHHKLIARNLRWPDALASRVGRDAVERGALMNALRVEPALGTPARGGLPETVARRCGDDWLLSGRKIYATGAPALSWLLVWARTDDPEPLVGNFLVPAGTEGVSVVETWDQLGLRASASHDVVFENVLLPKDHAVDIRPAASWRERDPYQAVWNALLIGAVYTGVAEAARDWLVRFLTERAPSNLGQPLATLPRMQEALGTIEARLLVNQLLIATNSAQADADAPPSITDSNLIKTVLAEGAIAAVEQALQLAGNHGLSRSNPLERHFRDVLCARVHTPQADSAYSAAGRAALGTGGD